MGDSRCGFGFCLVAFGAVPGRLVSGGVDLIERFTGLDIAALDKVAFQDNTADLRANFSDTEGRRSPWEFSGDGKRFAVHYMYANLWRLRLCLLVA